MDTAQPGFRNRISRPLCGTFSEVFPNATNCGIQYTPDFAVLIGTPERLQINYRRFMERAQIPRVQEALLADGLDGISLLDSFMMQ